ncbi:hypothetical protein ACH4K8_20800 [Streptomyces anulatus]
MSNLPIDTMPAEDLAVHLMTSGFALTGGEPEARRLLAEMHTKWAAEDADKAKATRMQDAAETLHNRKEPRHG